MAIKIARESWLGIGVEDSANLGTAVAARKYLPYLTCTLRGNQDIIEDEAVRGRRERVTGAILGPKRGEGDVEIILDAKNAPFIIIPALGDVTTTATTTNAKRHTITRKATSVPRAITLIYHNINDTRNYSYGVINTFEIAVSDGLATLSSSILSKFPATGATGSGLAFTTDRIFGFKDCNLYFTTTTNSTYADLKTAIAANTAVATKVTNLSFRYNNNAEIQHVSGSEDVDTISMGQLEIEGDYTLFFENTVQRDLYEGLDKKSIFIQFKGDAIDSDWEEILIGLPKIHLRERTVDTAIAGFLTENPTFVAEYDDVTESASVEIFITNTNSGTYYSHIA